MARDGLVMFGLWFFFLCLPGLGQAQGLVDPYTIFLRHYEVIGGLQRLKAVRSSHSRGEIRYDGLHGVFAAWEKRPMRSRLQEDYGVFRQVSGDDGHFAWFQDANNRVLIHKDEETVKRRLVQARLENFEHLQRDSPFFSLHYQGVVKVDTADCYLVRLENRINDDISWFYFNTSSFLLEKQVIKQPDVEFHTVYGDYRPVAGLVIAFHEDTRIEPRGKRIVSTLQEYIPNIRLADELFAIPPQGPTEVSFPPGNKGVSMPFTYIENSIYLPVTINGETRLWILDSGASTSIIDGEYARQLGLVPQGEINGFGFGDTFKLAVVTLPPYQVGQLCFKAQKIFIYNGLTAQSYEPTIAGLLGYDFLSRLVTRIDYAKGLISFFNPATFVYHGTGVVVDAPLKYNSFSLPVRLDNRYKGRWGLDLGADDSSLFYQFAQAKGYGDRGGVLTAARGLGGAYIEKKIRVAAIDLAGFVIANPLLSVPLESGRGTHAVGSLLGNIGNSLLQHFTIILDYKRQQVILEKGGDFATTFPEDGSGLVLGLTAGDEPMVSYVAPDTPAAFAGLRAGDRLLQVNDVPVRRYGGIVPIKKLLRGRPGTVLHLQVQRGERIMNCILTLAELW